MPRNDSPTSREPIPGRCVQKSESCRTSRTRARRQSTANIWSGCPRRSLGVDSLIFGSEILTLGAMIAVGAIAAAVLGLIVYRIQRKWYRDDHDSVSITALVIALLTAIPVPITCLLSVSAGIARVMNWLGKKRLAKSKSKFIKLHAQVTRQFIVPTGLPVCLGSNT